MASLSNNSGQSAQEWAVETKTAVKERFLTHQLPAHVLRNALREMIHGS